MTPEERDIIQKFVARVGGGASGGSGFASGASVPATQQQPLPPVDPEADRFIAEQFNAHPEARYRITQMAFVQEAALAEAQNRIRQLEYQLQQAQAGQSQPQTGGGGRGLFGGLFGGGGGQRSASPQGQYQAPPPPPQASYPPGYQPGMFQQRGSGFLGSALTTAAGVAGGVLAADALTSMFSPHAGFGGGWGGGGFGGGAWGGGGNEVVNETVVNNYGDAGGGAGGGDPWAGSGTTDPGFDPGAGGGGGGDAWSGGGSGDAGFDGGGFDGGGGGGDGGGWDGGGGGDDSF